MFMNIIFYICNALSGFFLPRQFGAVLLASLAEELRVVIDIHLKSWNHIIALLKILPCHEWMAPIWLNSSYKDSDCKMWSLGSPPCRILAKIAGFIYLEIKLAIFYMLKEVLWSPISFFSQKCGGINDVHFWVCVRFSLCSKFRNELW